MNTTRVEYAIHYDEPHPHPGRCFPVPRDVAEDIAEHDEHAHVMSRVVEYGQWTEASA